ncbi:hypothetical protein LUZ61_002965 [Rhynchospora tenuis]|uniref:SWIM-type domain-containing protein n=1 Tax=Rhynchospora tenuis TaxID=198213 RepID=A0AAD5ZJY3_9POAL|nr:hypothetical protein LUZ61_002965 [Rhynchospora tenuis]
MTFSSENEAFEFFNDYAKRKGFSVRKSIIKRDKTNAAIKYRRFYCSRHGFREKKHIDKPNRKRQHKLLTRCGCPVKFCVRLDKRTGMWWVQDFIDCHNHDLAAVDAAPFLRSHCFINEAQKLEISSKRASGIRNCQILDYDARCRGGYQNRGYQEKNLYNFSTGQEQSKLLEDDADSIISTIMFACGIVSCENTKTYRWLLEAFLEAMYQVHPESVITDGDLAMGKAIKSILKGTTHRICSWHMERNANKYIHGESAMQKFRNLVYTCSSEEFEEKWKDFEKEVSKRSPSRQWLQMIYRLKESWAAAFVKKKMFLGMSSTQRSESLNARLHVYIKSKMSLCRAIQQFERCLTRMRTKEAELDCIAFQKEPVLQTPFLDLEKSVVSNYTLKVFYIVQKELERAVEYVVGETFNSSMSSEYVIARKEKPESQHVVRCSSTEVDMEQLSCTCAKLEYEKIPCRHIFAVLIHMKAMCMPRCCIPNRWTKYVKSAFPSDREGGSFNITDHSQRFHELNKAVMPLLYEVAKSNADYLNFMEWLKDQKRHYEHDNNTAEKTKVKQEVRDEVNSEPKIGNPKPVVTKGAPKKNKKSYERIKSAIEIGRKKKCGHCGQRGHNRQTCQKLREDDVAASAEVPNHEARDDIFGSNT